MKGNGTAGHLSALLTIIIWGTTFISTKILLTDFQPVEILFFRFVMGLLALLVVYPQPLKGTNRQQELTFAAAGLCGICLYYLLENIALTYTMASNVGVIISVAPFFTAILSHLFLKEEKPHTSFFIGFVVAMTGIALISFNGSKLELNPTWDLLALLAALIWACYSVLTKKISGYGYHTILTTRRVFCYGILFMLPTLFLFDFRLELARFANPVYLFNILFLGLGASALCFVTWNFAVKALGAVKTSVYIYMVPVITVVTSVAILHEKITALAAVGTVLTLASHRTATWKTFALARPKSCWSKVFPPLRRHCKPAFPIKATSPIISTDLLDWPPVSIGTSSRIRRKCRMKGNGTAGHLSALLTIIIWGTTFISTKILLTDFQPVEILFFRFVMGLLALLVVYPQPLKGTNRQQELTFAAAGLCGICLYYLLENIALTYTMASNVGVIISVAPFFTAILSHLFLKEEKPHTSFFIGFVVAMTGIALISFNGSKLELNPTWDLLALLAALIWACYSVLTKKISGYGYHTILTTRRVFCYGILFMLPTLFLFDFRLELARFANPVYLFNILFLGLGASALCFVTWNFAVKALGAVKTSVYIYMVPVITVVTSVAILHEKITALAAVGTALTLAGLLLSESKLFLRKEA